MPMTITKEGSCAGPVQRLAAVLGILHAIYERMRICQRKITLSQCLSLVEVRQSAPGFAPLLHSAAAPASTPREHSEGLLLRAFEVCGAFALSRYVCERLEPHTAGQIFHNTGRSAAAPRVA